VHPSFEILADGRAIHCLNCGYTSWNLNDVRARYCGHCHRWHDTSDADNILSMWTVFDSPPDFPGLFVAREFRICHGISVPVPTANHFVGREQGWRARPIDSAGRLACALALGDGQDDFSWFAAPIANVNSRLAMTACPKSGALTLIGTNGTIPVTEIFRA